jgi:hypothetical protein
MKITGGTQRAIALLAKLQQQGHLVDVYSQSFFDRQPSIKDDPKVVFRKELYKDLFVDFEDNIDSDQKPLGHLLLVYVDGLNSDLRKALIEVYEPLENLIDAGTHNPDFLIINLFTKQVLCIALGKKNRLFAIDAQTGETVNTFGLLSGLHASGLIAKEDGGYMDRFTQHDVYEFTSDLVHALHKLGVAMFNYDSTIADQYELEHTLASGPNHDGFYQLKSLNNEILDDEEYSKEDIVELLEEIIGYQKDEEDSMKLINIFFPECYQGDLNTGDY